MKLVATLLCSLFLMGCVAQQNFNTLAGGNEFSQAGLTYTAPEGYEWNILVQQTYRTNIATYGRDKNESYMISTTMYNIESNQNAQSFLSHIQSEHAKEPDTGRFENLREDEYSLNTNRKEICVNYSGSSKDLGAKRGGEHTIYEAYGMHCIHPENSSIGVFIEISRKAPLSQKESPLIQLGQKLFNSVTLSEFKV